MTSIPPDRLPMISRADGVPGPKQGQWTYRDYAALDDGKRYEIVNGVLYLIPTPWLLHQTVVGLLAYYLLGYVHSIRSGQGFIDPLDVELAPDVVLQPDLLVILNAGLEKITETHVIGAPDVVIEVSSPGTIGYERREKQDAYAKGGVSEYWIANPEARTIEVLVLKADEYHSLGIFRGKAILPSRVLPDLPFPVEQFFR